MNLACTVIQLSLLSLLQIYRADMTFRSIDMERYMMIVPTDHAYETVDQLGRLQSAHFSDLGSHVSRPFQNQVRRCEQLLHKINMMKSALAHNNQHHSNSNNPQQHNTNKIQYYDINQQGYLEKQYEIWRAQARNLGVHDSKLIDYYEVEIEKQYERYQDLGNRLDKLKGRKKGLLEKIACMEIVSKFFGDTELRRDSQVYAEEFLDDSDQHLSGISATVGIIEQQAQARFNRVIYRVSRGYACVRSLQNYQFEPLKQFKQKVILLIYPNSKSQVLSRKLMRVMQTFCSNVTDLSDTNKNMNNNNNKKQNSSYEQLKKQYEEITKYEEVQEKEMMGFWEEICQIQYLDKWMCYLLKEKCLYENLNKLEVRSQFLIASIYIPTHKVKEVSISLSHLKPSPTLQPISNQKPPTAFETNSYTMIAQQIVDTYGVPRYKEINPSIFTTVTFPFFFGVMFGDIGHGLVLFALGLYLIFNDDKVRKSETFRAFSQMRYILTMMGFFAFYCGFIYNDLIGFNYNLFGSCYDPRGPELFQQGILKEGDTVPIPQKQGCVYPFGLDPIWCRAENQLVFENSLKMKLAVIIGVIHMTLGICVKAYNALYFKKRIDFWFEFVPQVTFMVILFGYMDFLIIFKWFKIWDDKKWAPSIISTMMNIGLHLGETSNKPDGGSSMWGSRHNSWQDQLQISILLVAVICVPLMLLPKPIIEIREMKRKRNPLAIRDNPSSMITSDNGISESLLSSGRYDYDKQQLQEAAKEGQHEDASEIFVHQLIETIQFVLGTVSNTASYLRLWALSLAHSQLAKVFFQKTLQNVVTMKSAWVMVPGIIVMFWMLCWITTGVLMCMDTLECFLHSLRLHWVQFQNKFYKGDGYRFAPLSFRKYLIQNRTIGNE